MLILSVKMPYYSPWISVKNLKIDFGKKNATMQKSISRDEEWCKFQLHSTFDFGVKGLQRMTSISVKTPDNSPWFSDFSKKAYLQYTAWLVFGQKLLIQSEMLTPFNEG